ncbi:MAG: polysaccharide biosynthesis protein [Desulfobacterales bacterium]|jgi:FlaA1/EpsC-like NDP-sugar epimerase|nr:polysaccharide biosynthesis protein [Desulfobacteraceae bacterium]MBT7086411.1 polysaccharide biosynthesis protein [Desulfobacterales bacterium]
MNYRHLYTNTIIVLFVDIIILTGSFYIAHLIRFDFDIPSERILIYKQVFPFVLLVKCAFFYYFDLYRGMWRYTSIADLANVIKAASFSTISIVSFFLFNSRFEGLSRSVFAIDWCFTVLFIAGFRLIIRLYFEYASEERVWLKIVNSFSEFFLRKTVDSKRIIIIGAGDCGEKIYREIRNNSQLRYKIIGFLDDNPAKVGMKIHGIPVLGNISQIKSVVAKVKADEAIIALPSATSQEMRCIVASCEESGMKFRTVPGYGELINGKVTLNALRDVAYRDLIGREVIKLDEEKIGAYLTGKNVLVTGAGGSIGSELCRQICKFKPQRIILYEIAESPLYDIDLILRRDFNNITIIPFLADIIDKHQLQMAFEKFQPQIVFHAAAYKHVPMLELFPWKAVINNIHGTLNLIEISKKHDIERFVLVSTDKAVRPTNVMGATKRVAEMLIHNQNGIGNYRTRFTIVRFGNVVGSVGSVIPLFRKQIEEGGPVTVTHREMTRYFMTIPEASQLILQAGALGNGGRVEIFIFNMGTPVKIDDMARDLIRLSGFEPDVDIKIKYIGLRHGEKLYEELITDGENVVPTTHEKIMVLKGLESDQSVLNGNIDELYKLSSEQKERKIKEKLQEIVPEYRPTFLPAQIYSSDDI